MATLKPKSSSKQVEEVSEVAFSQRELDALQQNFDYPDESELTFISDGKVSEDGSFISSTILFKEIGDKIDGIFLGMEYQVTRSNDARTGQPRPFAIGVFRNRDGSEYKCFFPRAIEAFIFGHEFPVGEYLSIKYIGDLPIAGRNPMKMFQYGMRKSLQLQSANKYLSVAEMRQFYNPKLKNAPAPQSTLPVETK